MSGVFRALWRHSALPVLLLLAGLLGMGILLQSRAIQVQGTPLEIVVTSDQDPRATVMQPGAAPGTGGDVPVDAASPAADAVDEARAAFAAGLERQRAGDHDGAAGLYRRALELRPTFWEAAYNLGLAGLAADRIDEAIAALERALALGGGERKAMTLAGLGRAFARADRLPEAERAFEDAIVFAPADLDARVGLARLYQERMNRPGDALRLYREALKLDEQFLPAWLGMARLRIAQDDLQEAERVLERVVAIDPASVDGRVMFADLLSRRGETERARAQLSWLIEHTEAPVEAWFRLGRLDYARTQYRTAADDYRKAIEASGGTHVASINNLGLTLKALGDIAGARASFEEAVHRDPEFTSAFYNLGLLALDRDDLETARTEFERAVRIDPAYAEAWYNLGIVDGLREDPRGAIAAYQAVLALDAGDTKARLNLAVQYRRAGEPEQAVGQYRILLTARPTYAAAWFNLALVQRELGRPREAEEAYRTAIRLEPGEMKHRSGLGLLYAELGRYDDAARLLREALEIDPRDTATRYNLAIQERRLGHADLATDEVRRVLALDPGFEKGWLLLAELLAKVDDHHGAADALSRALILDPSDAITRYELGKERFALGLFGEAVASYRESLDRVSDNAWIWYHLGKAQQALGEELAAQESWRKAVALDPDMGKFVSRRVAEPADAVAMVREQLAVNPASVHLRLALAEQLARAGDGPLALAEVRRVLKDHPSEPDAWKMLAGIYLDQEAFAAGEDALTRARTLQPGDPEVAYQLGRILVRREKLSPAVPHLAFAAAHTPDPLPALRLLGNVQYDLRDFAAAIGTLSRAVALEPDDGATLIDLGKAYYRKKDYQKALEHFAEARRLMPGYSWSGIWLGRAYVGLKDWPGAEAAFKEVAARDPGFIQGYLGLGDLAEKQGNPSAAREYYRRALQIDPLHQGARDRLSALP
jgi:tetratricopeptide (TPR) repeat protein